jgi:carbon-monoxide dehydrogenase large subunit
MAVSVTDVESPSGRYVGTRERKQGGDRFLTGRTQYVNDIVLPGTVYMSVVRSPHAHARIASVDLSRARADGRCLLATSGAEVAEHVDPIPHFIDAAVFGG